jgi:Bacteriocin-protection, YdeI or OmpD-Associated/Domain of unknown function (DUF1905)
MSQRFETVIEVEGKAATYFDVPLDVPAVFGRARPPVRVTIGGHTYRSTIAAYGGSYMLPLNRASRAVAGVAAGDTVTVELELDLEPRTVEAPDDLRAALAGDEAAAAAFDRLSYTHRREYVEWITEAKRDETRARRLAKTLERLRQGKPPP